MVIEFNAKQKSKRETRAAVVLLCLSSCLALAWGLALARMARGFIPDFKVVYFGVRCIVKHQDPYNPNELLRVYLAEGGERVLQTIPGQRTQMAVAVQTYLPSGVLLIAPFGLLSWPSAYALWILFTIVGITTAAALMWRIANQYAAGMAFYLVSFVLFNSGILFAGGNPAGIAVGLCIIAAWCFIRNRHVNFGIACMAASLAIKPHDAGLVWLYFLLAGTAMRKQAIKTLLLTVVVAIVALAWVGQISPHWLTELQQNVREYALQGGYNDPGPVGNRTVGPGMIIDLQTVTSLFRDNPHFYQLATYLLFAPFLGFWAFLVIRSRYSETGAWFALAAIAPLTMLPVYHRPYDAKLLLLAIPACAMLWPIGKVHAWLSLALTGAAILFTSDLPLAMLSGLSNGMHIPTGPGGQVISILLTRPAPLALLALGAFNLFQYARVCRDEAEKGGSTTGSLFSNTVQRT